MDQGRAGFLTGALGMDDGSTHDCPTARSPAPHRSPPRRSRHRQRGPPGLEPVHTTLLSRWVSAVVFPRSPRPGPALSPSVRPSHVSRHAFQRERQALVCVVPVLPYVPYKPSSVLRSFWGE